MSTRRRPQGFQLEKVWAKNFRSIADTSIELDQTTVLVGPNAAGKSNVLDILRFVKDALRFDLEAAISLRHGFDAIRRRATDRMSDEVEIGLSATTRTIINRVGNHPVEYHQIEYGFTLAPESGGSYRVKKEYATVRPRGPRSSDAVEFQIEIEEGRLTAPVSLLQPGDLRARLLQDDDEEVVLDTTELWLSRMARSWALGRLHELTEGHDESPSHARTIDNLLRRISMMRFYHIFPNTIRDPQKLGNPHPLDEDAGNLASVLRGLERGPADAFDRLRRSFARLVPGATNLEVTSAGGYLVVRVLHEAVEGGVWVDLSQESDGTIRLLGLLTALHQRAPIPLPLIGIEEPELTVHPGALTAMADELKEAARRTQLIITTHSPELIDRITDFRDVDSLRVVELVHGATQVHTVSGAQKESVKQHLFSPGELHRQGELERFGGS